MNDFMYEIMMDNEVANDKIFETDEIIVIKKATGKRYSSKQLRARRRKANAKEKNARRKLGTSSGNPYRGNPGDYYRHERMYNKFGMDRVMKHESEKIKAENREYLGKVQVDADLEDFEDVEDVEDVENVEIEDDLVPEKMMTALDFFLAEDYVMLGLCLDNMHPREKVIEMLKSLDLDSEES